MSAEGGRILALDLGSVRIGVAISDPSGVLASPLGTLERRGGRGDLRQIATLVAEHGVRRVVVGLPLLMSGAEGSGATDARRFADALHAELGVPVETCDERLTTRQAERAMLEGSVRRKARRRSIDALAATLLLQTYLDARTLSPPGEVRS